MYGVGSPSADSGVDFHIKLVFGLRGENEKTRDALGQSWYPGVALRKTTKMCGGPASTDKMMHSRLTFLKTENEWKFPNTRVGDSRRCSMATVISPNSERMREILVVNVSMSYGPRSQVRLPEASEAVVTVIEVEVENGRGRNDTVPWA